MRAWGLTALLVCVLSGAGLAPAFLIAMPAATSSGLAPLDALSASEEAAGSERVLLADLWLITHPSISSGREQQAAKQRWLAQTLPGNTLLSTATAAGVGTQYRQAAQMAIYGHQGMISELAPTEVLLVTDAAGGLALIDAETLVLLGD